MSTTNPRKIINIQLLLGVDWAVNQLSYIKDDERDIWQTPQETYEHQGGDCEDLSIAKKYKAQLVHNIPEEDLVLVIGELSERKQMHCVLLYEDIVFDNIATPLPSADRVDLLPLYAFTEKERYAVVKDEGTGTWELVPAWFALSKWDEFLCRLNNT